MKRIQLKEAIKQVVRQVIEERKRSAKNIAASRKKSKWNKNTSKKVSSEKKSKKIVKESGLTSESGSDISDVEKIAKFVKNKSPKLSANNAAHVISQLYLHKHNKPIGISTSQQVAAKHFNDTVAENDMDIPSTDDADSGISVDQDVDQDVDNSCGDHEYSEDKELELISLIGKAVAKLLSMHKETGLPTPDVDSTIGDDSDDDTSESPFASDDSDTSGDNADNGSDEFEAGGSDDETDDNDDTSGEEDLDEASYKVVSPNAVDTSKENKARQIQTEPKVSENYKIQNGPSLRTANDSKSNPKNVRNPKLG